MQTRRLLLVAPLVAAASSALNAAETAPQASINIDLNGIAIPETADFNSTNTRRSNIAPLPHHYRSNISIGGGSNATIPSSSRCHKRPCSLQRRRAQKPSKNPIVRGARAFDRGLKRAYDRTLGAVAAVQHAALVLRLTAISLARSVRDGLLLSHVLARAAVAMARRRAGEAGQLASRCRVHAIARMQSALARPSIVAWQQKAQRAGKASVILAKVGARAAKRAASGLAARARAAVVAQRRSGASSSSSSSSSRRRAKKASSEERASRSSSRGGAAAAPAGSTQAERQAAREAAALRSTQREHISRILALDEDDHYGALGLDHRGSSARQAKSAFRNLARLLHPDKCKERRAHEAFLRLQAADSVLTDAEKRAEYDQRRSLERRHAAFGGFGNNDFELHSQRRNRRRGRGAYY